MPGFGILNLRLSFTERSPTAGVQARLANLRPALERIPRVMRFGEGSIEDQLRRQATLQSNGRVTNWKPTRPFGRSKPGPAGLIRTGKYAAAWLGQGAGSSTVVTGNSVTVGVSPTMFPQTRVFQGDSPTHIHVTDKMRRFLAAAKGVYLRRSTQAITVDPRAFRTNPAMTRRARQVVLNWVVNGRPEEYRAA